MAPARDLADHRRSGGSHPARRQPDRRLRRVRHRPRRPAGDRRLPRLRRADLGGAAALRAARRLGSYDWRSVQGYGDNLLPMLLVDRGGSLSTDARFADLTGDDGVPEIAVGRVPAFRRSSSPTTCASSRLTSGCGAGAGRGPAPRRWRRSPLRLRRRKPPIRRAPPQGFSPARTQPWPSS